jgi:hypothetical protein
MWQGDKPIFAGLDAHASAHDTQFRNVTRDQTAPKVPSSAQDADENNLTGRPARPYLVSQSAPAATT